MFFTPLNIKYGGSSSVVQTKKVLSKKVSKNLRAHFSFIVPFCWVRSRSKEQYFTVLLWKIHQRYRYKGQCAFGRTIFFLAGSHLFAMSVLLYFLRTSTLAHETTVERNMKDAS